MDNLQRRSFLSCLVVPGALGLLPNWSRAADGTAATPTASGFLLIKNGDPVNLLSRFTAAEASAIQKKVSSSIHQIEITDVLLNERSVRIPFGRFNLNGNITISNNPIELQGDGGCELRWTDGNYVGLRLTSASVARSRLSGLFLRGTSTRNPKITLLKADSAAGYLTIDNVEFAYADVCEELNGVYIVKERGTRYSNANTYIWFRSETGSTADYSVLQATFGTSSIGSDPLVRIAATGARLTDSYFETQTHAKVSLESAQGAQTVQITGGRFEASGEVVVRENSSMLFDQVFFNNTYSASNRRTVRVDGGASASLLGGRMVLSEDAEVSAISNSGSCDVIGTVITGAAGKRWTHGIVSAGAGRLDVAQISGCKVGISLQSGSTNVVGSRIHYVNNGADLHDRSSGAARTKSD
jgi:hypothetical protein